MKMSELILAIGDDNVEFQNLDRSMIRGKFNHRKGSEITFGTVQPLDPRTGTKKLGLIIWLDREAVQSALASTAEQEGGAE